jgi:hypothetical protein
MFERVLDGFALGINHGLLWCNDDFRFHLSVPGVPGLAGESCGKKEFQARNFLSGGELVNVPSRGHNAKS